MRLQMPRKRGIVSRINRAFLFQGGLIAVAAILGVFFAKLVIEEILVKNAILEEEEYFSRILSLYEGD